ncbi:MAG: FAD-dependent oxidoreductase, partial [Thalassolituus sp.]
MKKIAIVGAGVAGLTALQALREQGHEITVFDKSRGSGGRLSSKKVGDSSWDMGAQFLRAHTPQFAAQLKIWEQQGWISEWQVTPWLISAEEQGPSPDEATRYVGMPRMTGLSRKLLEGAHEFFTQTRITDARYPGQWMLSSEDGQEFGPFDELILNVPPQQALPLLPPTSALAAQIESLQMLPCWTLLLGFTQTLTTDFDAAFVKDSPIAWVARNNSKHGRDSDEAWVVQASHEWSTRMIDAPREEVQRELTQAFTQLAGELPDTSNTWLHRWLYS